MERKISVQLYTVREQLESDLKGSLRRIADIGYKWIEPFHKIYNGKPAQEFRSLLASTGLKLSGSHAGIVQLREQLSDVIEYLAILGCPHLICSKAEFSSKQDVYDTADFFNHVGKKARERGMFFSYHNHAHEFQQYGGNYILDILLEKTEPDLMGLELDVYWAAKTGIDPAVYQKKWQDRSYLLHCKDMDCSAEKKFAAVGEGMLNFPEIIKAAPKAEFLVVEQDISKDPFHSIEISFNTLSTLNEGRQENG